MIAQLRGTLLDKRPNQVLIDVGGVGYQVHIPLSTYSALGDLHSVVTLLVHTHMREDGISLYGFLTSREKHCFELLIAASGVGPVLAMKILSGISVEQLVPAIRSGEAPRAARTATSPLRAEDRAITSCATLAHPNSSTQAAAAMRIKNAVRVAKTLADSGINQKIVEQIAASIPGGEE